jgi:hypothetical protein
MCHAAKLADLLGNQDLDGWGVRMRGGEEDGRQIQVVCAHLLRPSRCSP